MDAKAVEPITMFTVGRRATAVTFPVRRWLIPTGHERRIRAVGQAPVSVRVAAAGANAPRRD